MTNNSEGLVFFHGSCFLFKAGFQLLPQPDGYVRSVDAAEFELLVEARRPADKLSRGASVFLSADPDLIDSAGGYIDAVYKVQPITTPEASDLAWYSAAWSEFAAIPTDHTKMSNCIDGYWSGVRFHDETASCMEYRVAAAQVLAMTELNVEMSELKIVSNGTDLKSIAGDTGAAD